MSLLKDITILDFTHRLPGPLGTNILGAMGAKVIKLEDESFKDAFYSGLFSDFDPSFKEWYRELNQYKSIQRLDFKAPDCAKKIAELLETADAILLALPPKVEQRLGLDRESLKKLKRPLGIVYPKASLKHQESMHDLNALARLGLLSLFLQDKQSAVVAPPFLPISGITFGQQIATDLLGSLIKARQEQGPVFYDTYLFETAEIVLGPFWPTSERAKKQTRYLHNGAFPCYSLYRTKDGHYVGLAAVEEKYYSRAQELFDLPVSKEQRFERHPEHFEALAEVFGQLNKREIEQRIEGEDICLSTIEKL